MIESGSLILFLTVLGAPLLLGAVYALMTRPCPYYFKHTERGYRKIRYKKK